MKQKKSIHQTGRVMLRVLTGSFLLIFIAIGYLYVDIAVRGEKKHYDLYQYALDIYLVEEEVQGVRGTIFDKTGIPLAEQLTSYTIYANLYEDYGDVVENVKETAQKLSTVLDLEPQKIEDILASDRRQVEFGKAGRQLTYIEKEKIEQMELKGIRFRENIKRFYPHGVFASHTLGYAKYDEEKKMILGEMGLELYFDAYLQGKNGKVQYLKDRKGYVQPNKEQFVTVPVEDGLDVYLTIDSTIQTFLEEAMDKVQAEANPKSIVAVVANPKTGEIVGIGNRGSFDPNLRDIENYNNPIISEPFEPGSTMKIYTYAAAINEGKYSGSQYFQSGSRLFNGATIRDYNQTWGTITYDEGFYRSSNTAIVDLLTKGITPEENIEYFKKFGFGSPVNLPLPNEYSGTLPTDWDVTQKITAGFGQGIMTTPIQHIQAMTAILNQGQLIKPQLISKVYDPNHEEFVYQTQIEKVGNPITSETAKQVKDLMIGVIENERGSGKAYMLDSFTSGGKTGTAQVADGVNGYLKGENDYVYSYVGFAPSDDPQLVMYVAMSLPEKGGHDMVSQIYKYVMQNGLSYLGAERTPIKDIHDQYEEVEIGRYTNQTKQEVLQQFNGVELEPIIIGNGNYIYSQSPQANTKVLKGSKVFLRSSETFELPDFTAWTKDELVQFGTLTGVIFRFEGKGTVVSQSIPVGQQVGPSTEIQISLSHLPPKEEDVQQEIMEEAGEESETPSESVEE